MCVFTTCVLAQHIGHYGQVLPGRSAHSVGRSLRITRLQKHEKPARLKLRLRLRWRRKGKSAREVGERVERLRLSHATSESRSTCGAFI